MKTKFFKLSSILVISTAILSVIFSILYYIASERIDAGDSFLNFVFYVKKFFDLLAVFTGYSTIIFAFARYDFLNGLCSLGLFSASFLISFLYQVIGTCIYQSDFSVDFIIFNVYYSFGNCFITQMVPAIIVALITHLMTKKGTLRMQGIFSWKNSIQRAMLIICAIICGLNLITLLGFEIIPELIDYDFYITVDQFWFMVLSVVETILVYFAVEYGVYYVSYRVYDKYMNKN